MTNGRRAAGATRFLVITRSLQIECARVLHETLLLPVLTNGSETMIWREKERSKISAVHTNKLRGLLGIRRMDEVPNARIGQLCGVTKCVNEKIDEGVFRYY